MKTTVTTRDVGDVKIVELHGKITIGAGDLQMREAIQAAVAGGAMKILVDMKDVTTIDSSGVGELVLGTGPRRPGRAEDGYSDPQLGQEPEPLDELGLYPHDPPRVGVHPVGRTPPVEQPLVCRG